MKEEINMKDKIAQLRSITQSSPVTDPETKKVEVGKDSATTKKGKSTSEKAVVKNPRQVKNQAELPDDIASKYSDQEFDLVDRIKDYEINPEHRRMTYIIEKRNFDILNTLKNETGTPVINLINFFLDQAIKANSKEIDKIIRKQYQNLKL